MIELEEKRVDEMTKLRQAVEENNRMQQEKLNVLKQLLVRDK